MTEEHDVHLQRAFDERLMRVLPPPRKAPHRRSVHRGAALAATVLMTTAVLVFVADVNRTADAAGESCADVLAKVEVWFEAVKNGTTDQQMEFKRRTAELIGTSCPAKGATPEVNLPSKAEALVDARAKVEQRQNTSPGCQAVEVEIRKWAEANPSPSRETLIAFKFRANKLLEEACR
jgi:hypothetical protein